MRLRNVETAHGLKPETDPGDHPADERRAGRRTSFECCSTAEAVGESFSAATQEALRGISDWTVGERELMASFVSSRNRCLF